MKKLLSLLFVASLLFTACTPSYKIESTIDDPEQEEFVLSEIERLTEEFEKKYSQITLVPLAEHHIRMGNAGEAIKLYKDAIESGYETRVLLNNLGHVYEKVGEYDLAIEQYHVLIDKYSENQYLLDITWALIRDKQRKEAEKYFNAWQLEFQTTDEAVQQAIKKLRAEEKDL